MQSPVRSSTPPARVFLGGLLAVGTLLGAAGPTAAQGQWYPTDGISGANYAVYATTMWDPDGPGPQTPVLVLAGIFDAAGGVPASNIATWDGANWSALGAGVTGGEVDSVAVLQDGTLVAGGLFSSAGGVPVNNIARWDGANWTPLGAGMNNGVNSLTVLPSGDLVAGGFFNTADGKTVNRIARWDGSTWNAMGTGVDNIVWSVLALPNGQVIAGGQFFTAGGKTVRNIARWDGSTWYALGGSNAAVLSLGLLPSGDVMAGGLFTLIGNAAATRIARWDGASWHNLGAGMNGPVWSFAGMPNGDIVASGTFTFAGGMPAGRIARWNGANWSTLGSGMDAAVLSVLVRPDGDLIAGGAFTTAGGIPSAGLARYSEPACPADPTNLSTSEPIKGLASLSWVDNAVNETGYRVRREQFLNGVWKNATIVGTLGAGTTTFTQSPGQGFWRYQVQAFNDTCDSAWTPATTVKPAVPGSLAAVNIGGAAKITWTDNSDFESKFLLQRQQKIGNKWTNLVNVATPAKNAASYSDSPGIGTWRYRIRANSSAGNSLFTPWAPVTLP